MLYGIGIENGKEAQEVSDVIHRNIVEQDEVLVGSATPYVKAAETFASSLNAGQHLNVLYQIGFPQQGWGLADFLHRYEGRAHGGGIAQIAWARGFYLNFAKEECALQTEIHHRVGP